MVGDARFIVFVFIIGSDVESNINLIDSVVYFINICLVMPRDNTPSININNINL